MRRIARVDENQNDIVKSLVQMGCSVQLLHAVGRGCPDILVGKSGRNFLIEIKNPVKPKGDQELTSIQTRWHGVWQGQVAIAKTIEDAIEIVTGEMEHDTR